MLKRYLLEPSDYSAPLIVSGVAAVYNSYRPGTRRSFYDNTRMYIAYRAFLYLNYVLTIKSAGVSQELSEWIFVPSDAQGRKAREEIPREIARTLVKERAHSRSLLHLRPCNVCMYARAAT